MQRSIQIQIKYALDRILGVVLLILLAPVLVVIGLIIKLSDGHAIFFRQKRPGLHAETFNIWKFRTMVPDADRFLDEQGRVRGGNRITPIGWFLRSWSLDELPQLFNIVKGEMSFVGPRPALCEHVEKYTEEQKKRFLMKPGITGLTQVSGRNTLQWTKRIELDIEYIENYSLFLDLKILLKTIRVVLLREGIVLDRNPEQVFNLGEEKSHDKTNS